jgi:predicted  nucleic acid-binding Zn-ribbon protein
MSSGPEVEGLKALVATLQAQLQRARERLRALEEKSPALTAPNATEMESLSEALAAAQMQHVSALSEARRLQGEVGQLRASHALMHGQLRESEREVQSLLAQIRGGAGGDGDGDAVAAVAAWQGKAHRLSARLKRCKVSS